LLQFGDVKDIIILKDKLTGQPRGCAFVSYATKQEAEAAIAAMNKGVHLPGALCPMEVRTSEHCSISTVLLQGHCYPAHASVLQFTFQRQRWAVGQVGYGVYSAMYLVC
jgi:RNA recognition motif-containing protein